MARSSCQERFPPLSTDRAKNRKRHADRLITVGVVGFRQRQEMAVNRSGTLCRRRVCRRFLPQRRLLAKVAHLARSRSFFISLGSAGTLSLPFDFRSIYGASSRLNFHEIQNHKRQFFITNFSTCLSTFPPPYFHLPTSLMPPPQPPRTRKKGERDRGNALFCTKGRSGRDVWEEEVVFSLLDGDKYGLPKTKGTWLSNFFAVVCQDHQFFSMFYGKGWGVGSTGFWVLGSFGELSTSTLRSWTPNCLPLKVNGSSFPSAPFSLSLRPPPPFVSTERTAEHASW